MKSPLDTSLAYKYFMSYRLFDGQRFDEIIVPYSPARSFGRKLRDRVKSGGRKTEFAAMVLFLAFMCAFHNPVPLLILVALSSLIPLGLLFYAWSQPTHIALSPKGYRMYHVHWFGDKASPGVSWSKVGVTTATRSREGPIVEDWITFLDDEGEKTLLKMRLDGINQGDHRRRFLGAVKQFLPVDRIDLRLQDAMNPVRPDSHTSLWLQVLSSSPKRLRDDALHASSLVGNGRYRIIEQLGAGGQGTAYLSECINQTNNASALQVVLKEFVLPAEASLQVSKRAFDRIEREAGLLKRLSHPQIVQLLDLFVDDHRAYLVLEHVPGRSLRQIVKDSGPLREADVVTIGIQMAAVLDHLHKQEPSIIHRDFTPENIILMPDGQIKLIDFDVAQQLESSATRTIVGKHSFISPEQFRGHPGTQSDVYALGASMYYLLTGHEPLPISQAYPREVAPILSAEINNIVANCTAIELDDRFKSAAEVQDALQKMNTGYVR